MKIATAFDLMGRDIAELSSWVPIGTLVVLMTLALPFASLTMVLRAYRAAWFSVLVAAVTLGSWFLYYATDWWTNPGQGAWVAIAGATVVGWGLLVAALVWSRMTRGNATELVSFSAGRH